MNSSSDCHLPVTQLALFSRLCNEVLERRAAKKYDTESMMLAAKLLEQNPEVYTVWNYRREALGGVLKVLSTNPSTFLRTICFSSPLQIELHSSYLNTPCTAAVTTKRVQDR